LPLIVRLFDWRSDWRRLLKVGRDRRGRELFAGSALEAKLKQMPHGLGMRFLAVGFRPSVNALWEIRRHRTVFTGSPRVAGRPVFLRIADFDFAMIAYRFFARALFSAGSLARMCNIAVVRLGQGWCWSPAISIGPSERLRLHRLQPDLLCQHDIADHQIALWAKAPLRDDFAVGVEFIDVHSRAVPNAVARSGIGADHVEPLMGIPLLRLLRSQPGTQKRKCLAYKAFGRSIKARWMGRAGKWHSFHHDP
jgi:hypothetical protein